MTLLDVTVACGCVFAEFSSAGVCGQKELATHCPHAPSAEWAPGENLLPVNVGKRCAYKSLCFCVFEMVRTASLGKEKAQSRLLPAKTGEGTAGRLMWHRAKASVTWEQEEGLWLEDRMAVGVRKRQSSRRWRWGQFGRDL